MSASTTAAVAPKTSGEDIPWNPKVRQHKTPGDWVVDIIIVAILVAVVFVYRKLIWRLLKEFGSLCVDVVHGKFKWSEMNHDRRLIFMLIIGLLPLFLLFAPIPGTGMQLKDLSDQLGSDSSMLAEGLALLATSALLFLGIRADRLTHKKTIQDRQGRRVQNPGRKKLHTADAIVIGLTQCVAAVFPGLSRSGSTLSVGLMMLGINQQTALDYSFVLGIPAIAAAAVVSLKDLGSDGAAIGAAPLIAGVITAAIVGFLAIKLLKWIVTTNKLTIFAYYTLIAGTLVTVLGIIEHILNKNLFTGAPL